MTLGRSMRLLKSRAAYWIGSDLLPLFSSSSELKCVWKCCALCIYLSSSRSVTLAKMGIEKSRWTGASLVSSRIIYNTLSQRQKVVPWEQVSLPPLRSGEINMRFAGFIIFVWMRALDWKLFPSHSKTCSVARTPWLPRKYMEKKFGPRREEFYTCAAAGWMGFLLPILYPPDRRTNTKAGLKGKTCTEPFSGVTPRVGRMCSGKRKISCLGRIRRVVCHHFLCEIKKKALYPHPHVDAFNF
jgi:hypothetical protein